MMDSCNHLVTKGREGEKGSWCVDCGKKIFDVETRMCGSCSSFSLAGNAIGTCSKKRMLVTQGLLVTFKVDAGSCYQQLRKEQASD